MDAQTKPAAKFGSKNCPSRSLMEGKKRPHLFTSNTTSTSPDGVVTESRICSYCGTAKWTTTTEGS